MRDQKVSAWSVGAGALWIAALGVLVTAAVLANPYMAAFALATVVGAATLTVRCMLCSLAGTMHVAFDLGVEAGRREPRVPLQRV
jgi:uncharacterized membrane protein HdeD (DUF308 family)